MQRKNKYLTKAATSPSQDTRPRLVGVLNLSPESGTPEPVPTGWAEVEACVGVLIDQGADIIELGARSTNLSAPRVDDAEEQRRLLPVLRNVKQSGCLVAVDTWSLATACMALDSGADLINFTSTEPTDDLYQAVATADASLILTYLPYANAYAMRETAKRHCSTEDILAYFDTQQLRAHRAGCTSLIADPNTGIFHADVDDYEKVVYRLQAMELIARLQERGLPVLLHCSGKECLSSYILYATLLLRLGADYIRIHEPHIAVRLMSAGVQRPPAA